MVLPGEYVGAEEEFIQGDGTYIDINGGVRSVLVGKLSVEAKEAKVIPVVDVPEFKIGQVVYGKIDEMFESVAFVTIEVFSKTREQRFFLASGIIPVSEIKNQFIKSIREELKVGDIVKGTVVDITPFRVEVSLKQPGMGVVKAYCSNDRQEMLKEGPNAVKCTVCERIEHRHLASPYGLSQQSEPQKDELAKEF